MSNLSTIRVNFYIDGFNIYHRIADHCAFTGTNYRWLNYRALLENKLIAGEEIGDIWFFSAVRGDPAKVSRHATLLKALTSQGVKVKAGYFLKSTKKEKQTDTNITVQMLKDALNNCFDRCFLLSADTDFVPVLRAIQSPPFRKEAGIITPPYEANPPPNRRNNQSFVKRRQFHKLSEVAFKILELKFDDFNGCSLPSIIKTTSGEMIRMPKGYDSF